MQQLGHPLLQAAVDIPPVLSAKQVEQQACAFVPPERGQHLGQGLILQPGLLLRIGQRPVWRESQCVKECTHHPHKKCVQCAHIQLVELMQKGPKDGLAVDGILKCGFSGVSSQRLGGIGIQGRLRQTKEYALEDLPSGFAREGGCQDRTRLRPSGEQGEDLRGQSIGLAGASRCSDQRAG